MEVSSNSGAPKSSMWFSDFMTFSSFNKAIEHGPLEIVDLPFLIAGWFSCEFTRGYKVVPPNIAKLVYNSNNYIWFIGDISIVNGVFKSFYN